MTSEQVYSETDHDDQLANLYKAPVRATRGGELFNAFPYATKISPEAVALFIAMHTRPGDTVFDGFAGSGSTGLGAILCADPPASLLAEAQRLGLKPQWGARKAVLYEIGVLPSLIARVMSSPSDVSAFEQAATRLMTRVSQSLDWLYSAANPSGGAGRIRFIVWSDVLECPICRHHGKLWDGCVSRDPARISHSFCCPDCRRSSPLDSCRRTTEEVFDPLLEKPSRLRRRQIGWVYGTTNGKTWSRPAIPSDYALVERSEKTPLPSDIPKVAIPWGDLYRAGYHEGMTHLHHFYTRRNLLAFATLWHEIRNQPDALQDALRFWLLSYNASHSTIMTRVVAKKDQKELVVTSAEPGVLYVSGLPVEKNIFDGLRRKLKTITQAFSLTQDAVDLVTVVNESSTSVDLADRSIDYIFTDPPFGGNIPYSEVNFLNEAWLGTYTDPTHETIVSNHQNKRVEDYQRLLTQTFREMSRILKPGGLATVAFHSTSADVWKSLQAAFQAAGLTVKDTSVLEKTQGSFKQVTTTGFVRGDVLLLLSKTTPSKTIDESDLWTVADQLLDRARSSGDNLEMTPQRIYSRLVAYYLEAHREVPVSASAFYSMFAARQEQT